MPKDVRTQGSLSESVVPRLRAAHSAGRSLRRANRVKPQRFEKDCLGQSALFPRQKHPDLIFWRSFRCEDCTLQ